MEEIWKDIPDYEGCYQVSNLGRDLTLPRVIEYDHLNGCLNQHTIQRINERILKPRISKSTGYVRVELCKNGSHKTCNIHRLVALVFLPNPNNYPEVNHKDEDKTNNALDNLEWCTPEYNKNYGTRNTRISEYRKTNQFGTDNPYAKKVKDIKSNQIFNSLVN